MQVYLRTLTPVHIGTGEELSYLDYYIHQRDFYRISQDKMLDFLSALDQERGGSALVSAYTDWIVEVAEQMEELRETRTYQGRSLRGRDFNQTLKGLREDLQLKHFLAEHNLEKPFLAFLRDPQNNIRQYHLNGNEKQQIRGLIVTGNNDLYLPGSSLKGAIRTAMMYQVLMNDQTGKHKRKLLDDIRDTLGDRNLRIQQIRQRIGKNMEYSIAYCGAEVYRRGKKVVSWQDEQMDLFKFVQVSDARFAEGKQPVEVVASNLYLATKVKERNGNLTPQATLQPQAPGLEVIKAGVAFRAEVSVRADQLLSVYQKVRSIADDKRPHWRELETKAQALFGVNLADYDVSRITPEMIQQCQAQAEAYLYQAMTRFAQAQLDFEMLWVEEQMLKENFDRKLPPPAKFRQPFDALSAFHFNGTTLLRTGFATGFASTTELLYLLQDQELRDAFIRIMRKTELGKKPGRGDGKPYQPNLTKFPKSRLLITYRDSVSPLGWLEYIPADQWEKVKNQRVNVQDAPARSQQPTKPTEPVKPQYPSGRVKVGTILDAYVFKQPGPEKKVRVYVGKGQDTDLTMSYRADAILGKIILTEVSDMNEGKVTAVRFKGIKRGNR